jgi:2,3-bisphosphoglycerate-independent phosphoglycerate mutase
LAEVISHNELRQLHLAETEKFAHVTKFFNGDKQIVRDGEKDILVPSHKVATYDLDPEMSAQEIYDEFINRANDFDFVVINFANGDMVGHT